MANVVHSSFEPVCLFQSVAQYPSRGLFWCPHHGKQRFKDQHLRGQCWREQQWPRKCWSWKRCLP